MKRSKLRNKFLKTRHVSGKQAYNKQRNHCISLLREEDANYYTNLDIKDVTKRKAFWRRKKPYLSNKSKSCEAIVLPDKDKLNTDDDEVVKTSDNLFINVVKDLGVRRYENIPYSLENLPQSILNTISIY